MYFGIGEIRHLILKNKMEVFVINAIFRILITRHRTLLTIRFNGNIR